MLSAQGSEHLSGGQEMAIGDAFCPYTVVSGKPFLVENALADPTLRRITAVRALDLVSYAGVPIQTAAGRSLGTVCVFDRVPRQWDAEAVSALEHLAFVIGAMIEAQAQAHERHSSN